MNNISKIILRNKKQNTIFYLINIRYTHTFINIILNIMKNINICY